VLSFVGIVAGSALGTKFAGHEWREGWLMGWALNGKGDVELVLATLALQTGIFTEEIYSANLNNPTKRRDAVWFYEVFVPKKARRSILSRIPNARDSFKPQSSFPMYKKNKKNPNTNTLSQTLILLPASPSISNAYIKKICTIVNRYQ